jgi:hypothetical protein
MITTKCWISYRPTYVLQPPMFPWLNEEELLNDCGDLSCLSQLKCEWECWPCIHVAVLHVAYKFAREFKPEVLAFMYDFKM